MGGRGMEARSLKYHLHKGPFDGNLCKQDYERERHHTPPIRRSSSFPGQPGGGWSCRLSSGPVGRGNGAVADGGEEAVAKAWRSSGSTDRQTTVLFDRCSRTSSGRCASGCMVARRLFQMAWPSILPGAPII